MKWIGWLLRLSLTIVMVSVLTIMTTGYVVNSYIQSLLSSYNLPISGQAPSLGGMVKGMLGFSDADQTKSDKGKQGQSVTEQNAGEDALPVMGGISSGSSLGAAGTGNEQNQQQGQIGQQDQVLVTPDELVAKKDELADTDKEEVFKILMSKLPQEEMQKLTEAMEDGLTETEMIEIEQILSKYLDKSEYAKMIKLLKE
ncbi:hypothetical protein SAMN04488542_11187 [Fontibacillus panacisegetis]|uniref:Uncharacterized protein n=1 Tax=Fontibacillus panacisegetis TaxID=670482 RepID=A0A1G7LDH4_9BACL|nr:hypothetical protein [Fontibacillus panacisegetis]SDF47538.1 hypothetical protein SAMN04488542_11187 [Fontibacillus panacisegetis]